MDGKQLKNSILQWAIQGKLVPQNPKEGSGDDLFQKLKPFHNNIKPCKDTLDYSSFEFEIPSNWKMVQMIEIFNFVDYRGKTPNKINKGIFLITASNIKSGFMEYTRKEYISEEEYEDRKSRGITHKGDLLFTTEAPMGNAALCDLNVCSCGQRIITLQEYKKDVVLPKLFMFFILSPQFQMQLLDNCTGTTAKGIKAEKLKHLLIPLPPLAEQKRIVAKLEQVLPLAEEYGAAQEQLDKLNKELPEALKKSILQEAIQGKLVPQNPKDEPASALLAKIRKEKETLVKQGLLKKSALDEIPIDEEEIPFEIPDTWAWCRLGDIFDHKNGKQLNTANKNGLPRKYITTSNLYWDHFKLENLKTMYFTNDELDRCTAIKGDLLVCEGGDIGRAAIWNEDFDICIQNHIHKLRAYIDVCTKFFWNVLFFYKKTGLIGGKGIGIQGLSSKALHNILIPLPPLAEQKRIVDKLEQLFKVL